MVLKRRLRIREASPKILQQFLAAGKRQRGYSNSPDYVTMIALLF
jgi:pyruvate carboxylase